MLVKSSHLNPLSVYIRQKIDTLSLRATHHYDYNKCMGQLGEEHRRNIEFKQRLLNDFWGISARHAKKVHSPRILKGPDRLEQNQRKRREPRSRPLWDGIMLVYTKISKGSDEPDRQEQNQRRRPGPRSRPLWDAIMFVYTKISKDSDGSRPTGANSTQTSWA